MSESKLSYSGYKSRSIVSRSYEKNELILINSRPHIRLLSHYYVYDSKRSMDILPVFLLEEEY